jgi:hypothetical protein
MRSTPSSISAVYFCAVTSRSAIRSEGRECADAPLDVRGRDYAISEARGQLHASAARVGFRPHHASGGPTRQGPALACGVRISNGNRYPGMCPAAWDRMGAARSMQRTRNVDNPTRAGIRPLSESITIFGTMGYPLTQTPPSLR